MSESLYLTTGSGVDRSVYHTDTDCRALRKANNYREPDPEPAAIIRENRRECEICKHGMQGTVEQNHRNCRTCGGILDDDGRCSWCDAIDPDAPTECPWCGAEYTTDRCPSCDREAAARAFLGRLGVFND